MAIGGLAYLINSFANLLSPGLAAHLFPYVLLPSGIAKGTFCLWLLLAAVNVQRWMERAAAGSSGSVFRLGETETGTPASGPHHWRYALALSRSAPSIAPRASRTVAATPGDKVAGRVQLEGR